MQAPTAWASATCKFDEDQKPADFEASRKGSLNSLHVLPLDLVEAICQHLPLRDRLAFVSCCSSLWCRADVASSSALWGQLDISSCISRAAHLPAWLGRRGHAVRTLSVCADQALWQRAAPQLACGSPDHCENHRRSQHVHQGLELDGDRGQRQGSHLPPAVLHLREGRGLDWGPLGALSLLSRLELRYCQLSALPPQLSSLQCLRHLDLEGNPALGVLSCSSPPHPQTPPLHCGHQHWEQEPCWKHSSASGGATPCLPPCNALCSSSHTFAALPHLRSLTHLSLVACNLREVPWEVASLAGLLHLSLDHNYRLRSAVADPAESSALRPLRYLTMLTRLTLSACALHGLPAELAGLACMADLDLRGSFDPEEGLCAPAAQRTLQQLTALTRLLLSRGSVPRRRLRLLEATALPRGVQVQWYT